MYQLFNYKKEKITFINFLFLFLKKVIRHKYSLEIPLAQKLNKHL